MVITSGSTTTIAGIENQAVKLDTALRLDLSAIVNESDGDSVAYLLDAGSEDLPDGLILTGINFGTLTATCTRNFVVAVSDKNGEASLNSRTDFEIIDRSVNQNGGGRGGGG